MAPNTPRAPRRGGVPVAVLARGMTMRELADAVKANGCPPQYGSPPGGRTSAPVAADGRRPPTFGRVLRIKCQTSGPGCQTRPSAVRTCRRRHRGRQGRRVCTLSARRLGQRTQPLRCAPPVRSAPRRAGLAPLAPGDVRGGEPPGREAGTSGSVTHVRAAAGSVMRSGAAQAPSRFPTRLCCGSRITSSVYSPHATPR